MTITAQTEMLGSYRRAMEELKNRLLVLNVLLDGKSGLPNPAIQEFGFLQLRILCELIALACLTAHGDMPATREKRLREEYNPTKILKRLDQLHSDFYPRPIKVQDVGPNQRHITWEENGSVTKAELIRLYARASEIVHRGTVETLFDHLRWPQDTAELVSWGQKIVALLQHHAIRHVAGESYLLCMLEHQLDGKPQGVGTWFAGQMDEAARATLPGLHPSKPWPG